jgi:hypothetical protein
MILEIYDVATEKEDELVVINTEIAIKMDDVICVSLNEQLGCIVITTSWGKYGIISKEDTPEILRHEYKRIKQEWAAYLGMKVGRNKNEI